MKLETTEAVTGDNFDEAGYLAANPDIARAVRLGHLANGASHYIAIGHTENRKIVRMKELGDARRRKMALYESRLEDGYERMSHGAFNCLPDELARIAGVEPTDAVSQHDYDGQVREYVESNTDKLILDAGAGFRPNYYDHIVNLEIVPYPTTDVLGILEKMPFKSNTFDAIISNAVLEHVRDPFAAANEIVRVLKPGGRMFISVPFLQPYHGYPHHYYNMTKTGLQNLFSDRVDIISHTVPSYFHPIWVASWIFNSWASALSPDARQMLETMTIRDVMNFSVGSMGEPHISQLSEDKRFELASGTFLVASKKTE